MLFLDLDFTQSIGFIANYGRYNDTSGAVAGAILGAYHGFGKLPDKLKNQVIETNKKHPGIDPEALAVRMHLRGPMGPSDRRRPGGACVINHHKKFC
ncbi:MAG: ADP-ribosylglycohydrolase family protein [Cytophagales bacterium]|nr:ADP-ribosylglycohydrolase family protein [Cytophagales bacterium]